MALSKGTSRLRLGSVSLYLHHGALWLYYRENGKPVRIKVCDDQVDGATVAAQLNRHLQVVHGQAPVPASPQAPSDAPPPPTFNSISVAELRDKFLDYHEHVVRSSLATVRRYRAATAHLIAFIKKQRPLPQAHEIRPSDFAAYLRRIEVAPNGHYKTRTRKLRDKGIRYILETCRSMLALPITNRSMATTSGNSGTDRSAPVFTRQPSSVLLRTCSQPRSNSTSSISRWTSSPTRSPVLARVK